MSEAGTSAGGGRTSRPRRAPGRMAARAGLVVGGIGLLFVLVLLFPVAWLLVGTGLYLARSVPRWTAVLIALSQPVGFVGELSGAPKPVAVATQIAFAVGLIPIGVRVLRQSDEAWEQPSVVGEVRSAAT